MRLIDIERAAHAVGTSASRLTSAICNDQPWKTHTCTQTRGWTWPKLGLKKTWQKVKENVCVRVPGLPRLAGSLIRSDSLWCPPSARCTSLHTRTHAHTHYVPRSDIAEQGWRNAEEKMRAGREWGMKCRGKKRGTLLSSSVSGRTEIFSLARFPPWAAEHESAECENRSR